MEFDYTITTTKSFDDAVESVQHEIAKVGMRVLYVHDVQKTLAEKGFERELFKIVEFCSAKYANEFLNADIKIGLCMPCKINVYIKDGQTFNSRLYDNSSANQGSRAKREVLISGMRPIILPQFFPQADLGEKSKEIDQIIQNIINNAK